MYSQLFRALDPEGSGIVTGEKARLTFEKLGLPPNILGEIWQLADQGNLGFLTQFSFCYAMRLIGHTQAGKHPAPGLADAPGPLPKFVGVGLQPQSTTGSLLQLQPSSAAPPNLEKNLDPVSPVAPHDYARFSQMFVRTTGLEQTPLDGAAARDILMKAKLPTATLGQIWSLVDVSNRGSLDLPAFVVAMHLIQGVLLGTVKQLPPFLPDAVWKLVEPPQRLALHASVGSQNTVRHTPEDEWAVTAAQVLQLQKTFESLDTAKLGTLLPDQVALFLMTLRLAQQDLASIWDLADIHNTGVFTKLEFAIALFLVNRRRQGLLLPNIVPNTLIQSLKAAQALAQPQPPQPEPQPQPPQPAVTSHYSGQPVAGQFSGQPAPLAAQQAKEKLSLDELVDIFGSSKPEVASRASSSDLSADLPKVRKQLTLSFKPTSTFGQSLLKHDEPALPALPAPAASAVPVQSSGQQRESFGSFLGVSAAAGAAIGAVGAAGAAALAAPEKVDYDALRSVPPPPAKRSTQPALPRGASPLSRDLLAESNPDISGKLSEANTDIANISTQIKSLTRQTLSLHEKKTYADRELTRILSVKEEIDLRLRLLRALYANEVKQVEQVETTLAGAKEETEALRLEALIAEAKLNHVSGELHEKQVAVEELQKTNAALREKLGTMNAEIAELEKQLEERTAAHTAALNEANVRRLQCQVAIMRADELKGQLAEVASAHLALDTELARVAEEHQQAEQHGQRLQLEHQLQLRALEERRLRHQLEVQLRQRALAELRAQHERDIAAFQSKHREMELQLQQQQQQHARELEQQEQHAKLLQLQRDELASKQPLGLGAVALALTGAAVGGLAAVAGTAASAGQLLNLEKEPEKEKREPEPKSYYSRLDATALLIVTDHALDTPVTSPSDSGYQFPSGVVGGMVGMPGVLVGVQRTDLLTSSVQNNASHSVRDDNIEDERETLDGARELHGSQALSEGEPLSLGVELFEIVNADEAREKHAEQPHEEFPPIRELDIDESDSSEEQFEEKFDDARDTLDKPVARAPEAPAAAKPHDDFDAFEDLKPAAQELDMFDGFDDLKAARADTADDVDVEEPTLDSNFTGAQPSFAGFGVPQAEESDEWEQLFAGFGNAPLAHAAPAPQPVPHAEPGRQLAVQELVGMGFSEGAVVEALEREHWNLEAATNRLLDHA